MILTAAITALGSGAAVAAPARPVEVQPHRALYDMTLESAKPNSGVVGATGSLAYQWGESCDGWTIEQRYKLSMQYEQDQPVDINSNFVTWESKDGKSYRFNERRTRNGQPDEDIKGDATLKGAKGGAAVFVHPKDQTFDLPPGALFPTAHTLLLIRKAQEGEHYISADVFDGSSVDGAVDISAVVGPKMDAKANPASTEVKSPLIDRPSWNVRMAFFPESSKDENPDYELGMRLMDNGVSSEMTIDYGDYVIKAKLKEIQALPKPAC
ncbi:ATP-binding protein [Aliidongia dinghuensis]|uniref:ATP-binding protein n=1 Tax=Aliidongia dinghuensis TaxID=1867774 RepID=A0A8J2YZC2_9PROT|nr:ATP-binding protein [Aliidongia dinghuensis]